MVLCAALAKNRNQNLKVVEKFTDFLFKIITK